MPLVELVRPLVETGETNDLEYKRFLLINVPKGHPNLNDLTYFVQDEWENKKNFKVYNFNKNSLEEEILPSNSPELGHYIKFINSNLST